MFATAIVTSLLLAHCEPASLESRVKPFIDAHKGKVAVAVKNLATGETWSHNADEVMQTASLIKVAIMVEAYRQADSKTLDLGKMVTLTKDDKVQGSGILTSHFSDGASFPVRDAVRLMMVYSDNTATNLVLDQVGIKNVNATMAKLGFPETRINAKVFKGSTTSVDPERTKKYSLGSTTANDMVKLLELIQTEKAASAESCKAMLGHMKACTDKDTVVRFLPAGTVVAHKGGATNQVRTNAAIIYVPDAEDKKKAIPVALCVLTNENADQRWVIDNAGQLIVAKIGKAVYDHFQKK
ncbi:MAG: serine hydrolase [Planctomycetia bacterium]|nr:serine hydrolase [Planctomycetia bacterium]